MTLAQLSPVNFAEPFFIIKFLKQDRLKAGAEAVARKCYVKSCS